MTMAYLLRRLAGVDEEILKGCPQYDRIWATQIGAQLALTLLFLVASVYVSFSYINAAAVQFNPVNGDLELVTNKISLLSATVGIGLATLIAGCIFMFDRAIYQSDWFYQLPYRGARSDKNTGSADGWSWGLAGYFGGKAFRVVIRLGISLALAYGGSRFLELRIFESQLLGQMQRAHIAENAGLYDTLREDLTAIDKDIAARQASTAALDQKLVAMIGELTEVGTGAPNADIRLDELTQKSDERVRALDQQEKAMLAEPERKLTVAQAAVDAGNLKLQEYATKVSAEIAGNPEGLDGISGMPSCGTACAYWQERHAEEQRLQMSRLKILEAARATINKVENDFAARRQLVQQQASAEQNQIAALRKATLDELASRRDTLIAQKQVAVDLTRAAITSAKSSLAEVVATRRARMQDLHERMAGNPEFVQFRDGPLDRLKALEDVRRDERYGETITWFTYVLMFVVIFLEVAPVGTKLFFSPPSVYAMKLQGLVLREQAKALSGAEEHRLEDELRLEQLRRKLDEERRARMMEEAGTVDMMNTLRKVQAKEEK